jgi:hypothetical protein
MNYFEMGVQKYWAPTSSMNAETKRQHLEQMAASGNYLWSEKFDGNFTRAVITSERSALQTRGISKVTGTYSELQEKVFFWDSVIKAFQNGDTVILGELYLPGGIDKDVGGIARCLVPKALARQKDKKLEWRIFDILVLDGNNMINTPIEERVRYIPEVVSRINNPLVRGVEYHEMTESFFDEINDIFSRGGEGAICYKKGTVYTPDKRSSAWSTCKVKQEISADIDCFITGIEPAARDYTGKDIQTWNLWEDERSGEKLTGQLYADYRMGRAIRPISKGYYFGWPGAIYTSVYDNNGNIVPLCKVAGLTEDFKTKLRDNFEEWNMCPLTIGGMMISTAQAENDGTGISIRHPYIKSIRKNDIDPKDCNLAKILS